MPYATHSKTVGAVLRVDPSQSHLDLETLREYNAKTRRGEQKMRRFGTHGPVNKKDNYVVLREKEHNDFIKRIQLGRYIVLFAPRQTAKQLSSKKLLTR